MDGFDIPTMERIRDSYISKKISEMSDYRKFDERRFEILQHLRLCLDIDIRAAKEVVHVS